MRNFIRPDRSDFKYLCSDSAQILVYFWSQGDGGGPLVCEDGGYYELTGLVSWGFGCGRRDVPGVYVKISSFIGWINQIISVNNL